MDEAGSKSAARSGLSRREIIKRGAIAGGIAWTAPVLVGSVTPVGAQVGSPSGGYPCSYITVVYTFNGQTYAVKFNKNAAVCDGVNSTSNDEDFSTVCNGVTYNNTCSGTAICTGTPGSVIQGDPNCSSRVFFAGGTTITAAVGVTIIFAAAHDGSYSGSKFRFSCPSNPQPANSVTAEPCG